MGVKLGMNNLKLDSRTIIIAIIVVIAAIFVLPRLFNTSNIEDNPTQTDNESEGAPLDANVALGPIVSAIGIDRNGCATETTSTFEDSDSVYVVAEDSDVPSGTSVFVRLYHEGTPIEDAPEITADQDYDNTCINFVFEPEGAAFDPGSYEAEFIINGNPANSISFEIQ
jgi:hypothetical protein